MDPVALAVRNPTVEFSGPAGVVRAVDRVSPQTEQKRWPRRPRPPSGGGERGLWYFRGSRGLYLRLREIGPGGSGAMPELPVSRRGGSGRAHSSMAALALRATLREVFGDRAEVTSFTW
uniref:Uncharacterized protein n=1 Tax=Ammonifex degensii TaxID=42838 RepID=A0A7C2I233_9THEO